MDAIREYLKGHNIAAPHVIEGGLEWLVGNWCRIAANVESEQHWVWEDWVNDLDTRNIIQNLLEHVPESRGSLPEIEGADARFRNGTVESDRCLWGKENAEKYGWTPEKEWWYWRRPSHLLIAWPDQ
jgi:hypothetical protein